jgi:hypothetical protein
VRALILTLAKDCVPMHLALAPFFAKNLIRRMTVASGDQAKPPDEGRVVEPFLADRGLDVIGDPELRLMC